jgi:phosphatidylglycerophosphate synthase
MSIVSVVRLESSGGANHVREHGSLLASLERRALVRLAALMPAWINSDHLTALGVAGMAGAGLAFAAAPWSRSTLALVPVCLALNWFGDSLDGTLARVRGQQRPRYGYYLDHAVDLANMAALCLGMAASGLIHPTLAIGVLAAYLAVCAEVFLATHAAGTFRLSFSLVGPTELRIVLSIGALAAMRTPIVSPFGAGHCALFDVGAVVAIVGLSVAFAVQSFRTARALSRLEPRPLRVGAPDGRS